jgi:hypothetical protein
MFINKEELENRRREENNLVQRIKVGNTSSDETSAVHKLDTSRFKNDGTERACPVLSDDLRAVVAAASIMAGPKVAAEIGGVSEGYAEVLARGEYSSAKDPEERERRNNELKESIYRGLSEIRIKASEKLMLALDLINTDTLEAIQPKDKARLAAQMANQLSGVIDRTINKGENLNDNRSTHLHLYAPERRPISAFQIKSINQPLPETIDATSSGE